MQHCLKFHTQGLKSKTGGVVKGSGVFACVCVRARLRVTGDTMAARGKIRKLVRDGFRILCSE